MPSYLNKIFTAFALCASPLGLYMLIAPSNFWVIAQADEQGQQLATLLYGSVLMAVSILSAFAIKEPYKNRHLLIFIAVYKAVASSAFLIHGLVAGLPLVGWFIFACYAPLSLLCFYLYKTVDALVSKE